jgi:hypothetical protein
MFYFSKIFPFISCAIVIGLCWHRDTNSDAVTFIFKKKYWYASLELLIAIVAVSWLFRWFY